MTRACIYTYIYIWIYTCICTYVYASCCAYEWFMSHLWMSHAMHKYRHDANWYCTGFWREMKHITRNKQVMSHAHTPARQLAPLQPSPRGFRGWRVMSDRRNESCHKYIHRHGNWLPYSQRRVVFTGARAPVHPWLLAHELEVVGDGVSGDNSKASPILISSTKGFLESSGCRTRPLETSTCRPVTCWWYSQLQIGWHSISRLFLKLFKRTRILPMGFMISTQYKWWIPWESWYAWY